VGKPRAAACLAHLAELNPYVNVKVLEGELTEEKLSQFTVFFTLNMCRMFTLHIII
jgi:molybdopterin/thiamine biosynthesis adenylyltransferase